MSMFDTVTFRYRMPDGETESEYQTKDLDCECELYDISPEGRLLRWPDTDTGFDGCITVCAGAFIVILMSMAVMSRPLTAERTVEQN